MLAEYSGQHGQQMSLDITGAPCGRVKASMGPGFCCAQMSKAGGVRTEAAAEPNAVSEDVIQGVEEALV